MRTAEPQNRRTAEPQNRRTAPKRLSCLAFMLLATSAMAQSPPVFPPVPNDDVQQEGYGLWSNPGWVIDTDGELREDVLFVSEGGFPRTFIRKEASMSFTHAVLDTTFGGTDTLRRLDMTVVGAEALYPDALGSSEKIEERHFYLPHCGPTGVTNVVGYNRIVYPNVYPLIDLWVFSGTLGQKVMFVMWPGADPKDIELEFTGQNELGVDLDGWLRILLADEWISLPQPVAYQFDSLNTILPLLWTVEYEPQGSSGIVTLDYESYDPTKPLVFLIGLPPMGGMTYDEVGLCWSTYVGGDGTDHANDVETDDAGNIYATGYTTSSFLTFPGFPGLVSSVSGNRVAYLTKFDGAYQLEWTAFLGGDVLEPTFTESGSVAIREGADQRIFIGGTTTSQNLWTIPNGAASYDPDYSGTNPLGIGFVAEFNDQGALFWSTYFGDERVNITDMDIVPGTNSLVICGQAEGLLPEPDITPPTGSLDWAYAGGTDAFIAMFNTAGQLYMRSWWGGAAEDRAESVKAYAGKIVVAGFTFSAGLDMVDPGGGAYFEPHQGGSDIFILELSTNGVVQWSTYLGGFSQEYLGGDGLHIGPTRDVFLCGLTSSSDLGIVPGPGWYDDTWASLSCGFIARFSGSDRSAQWISYFGEGGTQLTAIIQDDDADERIHIAGVSPGNGIPLTPSALGYNQPQLLEISQGSLFATFTNEHALEHATWFGGAATTNRTHILALAQHPNGTIAVGMHEKYWDPLAYFPLDDGQGLAWFDELYNDQALSALGTDGFITVFCSELSVGVPWENADGAVDLRAVQQAGTLVLHGEQLEGLDFSIHDAVGREVLHGALSRAASSIAIEIPAMATGAYVIRLEDSRTAKFLVR